MEKTMGYHKLGDSDNTYGLIAYDRDGNERLEAGGKFSQKLIEEISSQPITNVFLFSHGWKGDIPAAIEQYDRWIGALMKSPDLKKAQQVFPGFRPLFIGLHWPSLPFGSEEARADGSFAASGGTGPDQMLAEYLERFGDRPEIRGPLETILKEAKTNMSPDTLPDSVRQAYLDLNKALGLASGGGLSAPLDADREPFDPEDAYQAGNEEGANFGDFNPFSGILGVLRQLSYFKMKNRARTVGEVRMHQFLKDLQTATAGKGTRIHLMGHSFGTIVISGMLGGPNGRGPLVRPVDSVVLAQGALSLWSYAPDIPFKKAGPGYFSRILADGKIAGPLVTTQSRFDRAVGLCYPIASGVHGSASFGGVGGNPELGAIGAYGIQGLGEQIQRDIAMLPADGTYGFEAGKVYNLESSKYICHGDDAFSGAHCDIGGPEVAHAIWEAAFASAPQRVSASAH
jgi:hypothetical protein